ncbi:signal peptidase I [Mycobacteroides abscessus subsp. abscessus]|nr:signal peptidase I [Mycobacteroides abscessus subsp. abscessus]
MSEHDNFAAAAPEQGESSTASRAVDAVEVPTHRAAGSARERRGGALATVLDWTITIVVALVVAVLIKTFLVQPFFIPSASMHPTLMEDDKILVSKLHPGVLDLHRGDVIVFQDPGHWVGGNSDRPLTTGQQVSKALSYVGLAPDPTENHLVKRLIGTGGDRIVCKERGGAMTVNGIELNETYIVPGNGACQVSFDVTVPEGKLWVMGDNRFNSADSSEHYARGEDPFVDESKVTGKAVLLFLPFDRWSTLKDGEKVFEKVNSAESSASVKTGRTNGLTHHALAA